MAWARIGPVSISRWATWTVVPVSGTPAARASRTACHPGKAGSRAGWVLRIRPGIGVVDRLVEHGAEAGHDHHVDAGGDQCVGQRPGVADPVEAGAESAEVGPVDQDGRHRGGRGHVEGPARAVGRPPGRPGSPSARMASRMVPLPEASTPIRDRWRGCVTCRSAGHGRTLPAPPGCGPSRRARRSGPSTAWLYARDGSDAARPACPPDGSDSLVPPALGAAPRDVVIGGGSRATEAGTGFCNRLQPFLRPSARSAPGPSAPRRPAWAAAIRTGRVRPRGRPARRRRTRPARRGPGRRSPSGASPGRPARARTPPACGPPWRRWPR